MESFYASILQVYISNEKFTKASAEEAIKKGGADAVAFRVPFIANPNLRESFNKDLPLNPPNPTTFYAAGPKGYVDYPFYNR